MHHISEILDLHVLSSKPCLAKSGDPLPINEWAEPSIPGY